MDQLYPKKNYSEQQLMSQYVKGVFSDPRLC